VGIRRVLQLAIEHLRRRRNLARAAASRIGRLWAAVDRGNIARSWQQMLPEAVTVAARAQALAADASGGYLDTILREYGLPAEAEGRVRATSLAAVASDGRPLDSLIYQPAITALQTIQRGGTVTQAMAAGAFATDLIVRTQVADAGRVADGVALVAEPNLHGYVRMLNLPSCSRCIILAGKFFEWNAGFERHPACDCVHVPAPEDNLDDLRTNPKKLFESMTEAEQNKTFTIAGAQAIRDGADMNQVVNVRRGAAGLAPAGGRVTAAEVKILRGGRGMARLQPTTVGGEQVLVSTEGTTRRGFAGRRLRGAPRLMPEQIYKIAGDDRDEALRLLYRNGYLLERPAPLKRPAPTVAAPPARPVVVPAAPKTAPRPEPVVPPKPVAPTEPAAPDAHAALERSIASGIRESEKLSGGAIGDVSLVTFNDGSQAVRKVAREPIFGYSNVRLTENEVLAEKVGRALRAPIPAVVRTGETEIFMQYVPDAKPGIWLFRGMGRAEQIPAISEFVRESGDSGHRLGLLDLLIANDDRHDANWLVRPDGSIVGIDHGLVWPISWIKPEVIERQEPRFKSGFAKLFNQGFPELPNQGYIPNDLTPADIDWVQARLEALRPDFDELGRGNYLDYSLARLRQLRPWARGTVNRIKP
jgi:hypothetical protein